MNHEDRSSHVGHIAFVVLGFLVGGLIGYYVGAGYEYANQVDDANFSGYFNSITVHHKTTATPKTSPSATVSPSATTSPVTQ